MIRISKKGDYAVVIMGFLAQRGAHPGNAPGLPCSAQEISQQTSLQKPVVANLLKGLTRAGLLESVRGIHGGYRLTRLPDQITLGQILRVVEGPFTLVDCTHPAAEVDPKGQCRLEGFCPSRSPMRGLHERIQRMIDEIRLPELCGAKSTSALFPSLVR